LGQAQIENADAHDAHHPGGETVGGWAYDLRVIVRSMRPDELDAAISVWREANIARGAPHGPKRTARIGEKLSASDALPFVALRPGVVGMALAEPGRLDDGAGALDTSLLHISMVFVRPAEQRTGVGLPLLLHILDVARSMGYQRVGVWTAQENRPARRLYERAGMTLAGKTAPLRSSLALQYETSIGAQPSGGLSADRYRSWNRPERR
jgi:GNAT superfamily N-acetyltransferase